MQSEVKKLSTILHNENIKNQPIKLSMKIKDYSFEFVNRDIMGHLIQTWFEKFLKRHKINWRGKGSQRYPDIILDNNQYLEIKCHFANRKPAWDIANFQAFVDDLLINPKRLNSDYLIFTYNFDGNNMYISDFFFKKIWEITSIEENIPTGRGRGSKAYKIISAQDKTGTLHNLRPYHFVRYPELCFQSRLEFIIQIKKAIDAYSEQLIKNNSGFENSDEWYEKVQKKFLQQTSENL